MAEKSLTSAEHLNPAALAAQDMAGALGLPAETIQRDIAEGAPTNADGSVNLVHYVAWLNRQLKEDDGD